MHTRHFAVLTAGLAMATWSMATPVAHAQLSACGDIHVEASAMCVVEVDVNCMAMCEPISFQASCAADLYVDCSGGCTAEAMVDCNTTCTASCMAECTVDPGSFDCRADCSAGISAQCQAECEAMAMPGEARGRCEASCEATYEAECSASCESTPPMADCMAACSASCEGSCTAEANVMCQVDCQADGYVECQASLMGGCEASCMDPDGALFCDGQYVDHGGNLDACIDALRDALDIEVDASARGSCESGGGSAMCTGEAEASATCAAVFGRPANQGLAGFGALGLALLLVFRRRHR